MPSSRAVGPQTGSARLGELGVDFFQHVGPFRLLRLNQAGEAAPKLDQQPAIERTGGGLRLAALRDAGQEILRLLVEAGNRVVAHEGGGLDEELLVAPTPLVLEQAQICLNLRGILLVVSEQG